MNRSQRNILLVIVLFISLAAASYGVYHFYHRQTGITRFYNPEHVPPPEQARTLLADSQPILVDYQSDTWLRQGDVLINPMVYTPEQLVSLYGGAVPNNNEWIPFRFYYVRWYAPIYKKRFNRHLDHQSKEVQLAYDHWQSRLDPP